METYTEAQPETSKSYLPEDVSIKDLVDKDNIADLLDEKFLTTIGEEVVTGFEIDLESRMPWFKRYESAMKLAMQVMEIKNFPWPKASNVKFPSTTLAALQFHARAYPMLVPSRELVNVKSIGRDLFGTKRRRAERIKIHMNYQFLDQMEEWEEDMDRLLITLPITGTEFKKIYYSAELGRPVSRHVFSKDLVVDYYASSLDTAARVTEILSLTHNEIVEHQRAGVFRNCDLDKNDQSSARDDVTTHVSDKIQGKTRVEGSAAVVAREILEQHGWCDLDGDGYKEPYIFTVDRATRKVLRIVARFKKENVTISGGQVTKIKPDIYYVKFDFIPSPDGGFYSIGFGTLIYPINEAVNTLINQLIDSGTLSTLQSGFISKQFKVRGGGYQFSPGEWKEVPAVMQDLKTGILPLPVREPSMVLFELLGLLINIGEKVTSTTDMLVGENPGQNQKATTTMAVIENGMKVFTAVYKRTRRALSKEILRVYDLNKIYLDEAEYFTIVDPDGLDKEQLKVAPTDYKDDNMDIRPTADPNAVSQFHKILRAEALLNTIQFGAPVRPVLMRYYEALEIENPEEVLPPPPEAQQPPLEAQLAIAESQREDMKVQVEAEVKTREQDRKELETMIKLNESADKMELEQDKVRTKATIDTMKVIGDNISQRRKIESDRKAKSDK